MEFQYKGCCLGRYIGPDASSPFWPWHSQLPPSRTTLSPSSPRGLDSHCGTGYALGATSALPKPARPTCKLPGAYGIAVSNCVSSRCAQSATVRFLPSRISLLYSLLYSVAQFSRTHFVDDNVVLCGKCSAAGTSRECCLMTNSVPAHSRCFTKHLLNWESKTTYPPKWL